jgi:hypothetical protein
LPTPGFGNHQFVDVKTVVVLGIGDGRLKALQHVIGDPLFREGQIGDCLVDLLATDQTGDEVQLLRARCEACG